MAGEDARENRLRLIEVVEGDVRHAEVELRRHEIGLLPQAKVELGSRLRIAVERVEIETAIVMRLHVVRRQRDRFAETVERRRKVAPVIQVDRLTDERID